MAIRHSATHLAFAAPPLLRGGPVSEPKVQAIADFLRIDRSSIIDSQWADNGPGWVAVVLESAELVLALNPPREHPTRIDIGVVGPYPPDSPVAFELRAFFNDHTGGGVEDPVTGSLNASVAQWLLSSGRASAPYGASQGTRLSRSGRVFVTQDQAGTVWVGGKTSTLFSGGCSI